MLILSLMQYKGTCRSDVESRATPPTARLQVNSLSTRSCDHERFSLARSDPREDDERSLPVLSGCLPWVNGAVYSTKNSSYWCWASWWH